MLSVPTGKWRGEYAWADRPQHREMADGPAPLNQGLGCSGQLNDMRARICPVGVLDQGTD